MGVRVFVDRVGSVDRPGDTNLCLDGAAAVCRVAVGRRSSYSVANALDIGMNLEAQLLKRGCRVLGIRLPPRPTKTTSLSASTGKTAAIAHVASGSNDALESVSGASGTETR